MTLFMVLLVASVLSSILVVAAGVLSSRMTPAEEYVETYLIDEQEEPLDGIPQTAE